MFAKWKALVSLCAIMILRAGGCITLEPFANQLFVICSAVTVDWCVLTQVVVCLVCSTMLLIMSGQQHFSSVEKSILMYKGNVAKKWHRKKGHR